MFLQVTPSVCWSSSSEPISMVPVGTDVLALLSKNIVIFHNLKTETKSYYKGDNAQTAAGISLLTGHNRYPLFAIAEAVLRPRIFVMRYPEMEKLTTIYSPDVLTYVDLVFSEFGFLAGMSGYPGYKLRLWNYRSGALLASERTFKKCGPYCLYPMKTDVEVVIQYAVWHKQILIWQLSHSAGQDTLHEVATIDLNNEFSLSIQFPLTYWDDTHAYVVNDYGDVYWIDVAPMSLKHAWSTPTRNYCSHSIYYNKTGLIIANSDNIYFIKRRASDPPEWNLECSLENLNGYIIKIVSDHNNNIYGVTKIGNIELLQHAQQTGSLKPLFSSNCCVLDYTILKGIKDEVVLILTSEGDLRLVDLIRMNVYSKVNFEAACALCSHNSLPYAAVGTTTGRIHFLSYEKPRAPVLLGAVFIEDANISRMQLFENSALVVDEDNGVHVMVNDFKTNKFLVRISLQAEAKDEWHLLDLCLLDEEHALLFLSDNMDFIMQYATEAWLYHWNDQDFRVPCSMFDLPYKYRGFTVLMPCTLEQVEILAVRFESNVIDVLWLNGNSNISIGYTLKTCHMTYLSCISGTRNVMTADTQSLVIHLRTHKKSKFPYHISRPMFCNYIPQVRVKVEECFNVKFLLILYADGCLTAYRSPMLTDNLRENKLIYEENTELINPYAIMQKKMKLFKNLFIPEPTDKELQAKDNIIQELQSIEKSMHELINYDMSVTGQADVSFRKFCLNHKWLNLLEEESRILCEKEREILLDAVTDQCRIRDWIFDLIKSKGTFFSTKLRSLFSNIYVASYTTRAAPQELLDRYDLFRFYNMEPLDDEEEGIPDDEDKEELGEEEEEVHEMKPLKRYVLEKGEIVFEHVMAKDFELQDVNIVSFNQMYNEEVKLMIILVDALKAEFNKRFGLSKNYKEEIMRNVHGTNATLQKIYSNMNCMLCLLKMDQFTPPVLSVPEWTMDENIERILTVDDSEIKAINRRKKIVEAAAKISKRMLLWSKEFWARALIVMMDGVLEKLWEEEIKKTPFPPEFMLKKSEHEYNLEEQRLFREYENKLKLLEEDRRKYLRILRDNEVKTQNLKKHFIIKLNEHIAEIDIWKLKYDFAIKHERLRLLNTKLTNHKRVVFRRRIQEYKTEINKLVDYIGKYEKLVEFFERSQGELKTSYENQQIRDRTLERQYKGQFLNLLPQHLIPDMMKVYRKRPKLPVKVFSTAGICFEMAQRVVTKKQQKFPLPQELLDFLNQIATLDDPSNCPAQVDQKYWDHMTRLRRQRIESELRLKGIGYQVHDMPRNINFLTEELKKLREARADKGSALSLTMEEYFDTVHNQRLELTLSMGQVEINAAGGCLDVLRNSVLMHVDDINEVNRLIKDAGIRKLKAMQRVAYFRRKVIFKEWEHKATYANIEYLQYILRLVERAKVTYEVLQVLRSYNRLKAVKETAYRVGYLEEVMQKKLEAARKNLDRLYERINETREQIEEKKRSNNELNKLIENVKVSVTYQTIQRDFMGEEKDERVRNSRMGKAIRHGSLMNKVRADYGKILELQTIYQIISLRTNEVLPPIIPDCIQQKDL